jgi:hypothetical protein
MALMSSSSVTSVDEDGERRRFKSVILLPYGRRSLEVGEVLPLLCIVTLLSN